MLLVAKIYLLSLWRTLLKGLLNVYTHSHIYTCVYKENYCLENLFCDFKVQTDMFEIEVYIWGF